jgi:probable F420-dependent oxidoreductase
VKFWQSLAFTEPSQLSALAAGAEAAGFEGVLLSEHLFVPESFAPRYPYAPGGRPDFAAATPFPDPWVTIGALSAATRRLRFATMVHILPLHHPLEVAKAVGSAAVFSNGRVALGVGAGWMKEEFDALGVDFASRGERFDESIAVLRKLWTGEMVEHHGAHFDFPRLQMSPAPGRPIPIFIGGASAAALRRAARLGDGWVGAGNTPEEAETLLGEIARLRGEAGRADDPFETIVPLVTPLDADTLQFLGDRGATGTVHYPFQYSLGFDATLAEKLDAMAHFGATVIAPIASRSNAGGA